MQITDRDSSRPVFICYASEDRMEAHRIHEGIAAAGVEVWIDQAGLRGGDAWERRIEGVIKTCGLFVAIVSGNTKARGEGFFRREWGLAIDRMRGMADDLGFLLPVSIDETWSDKSARVPDRFRDVQWTRLPGGVITPEFVSHVKHLLGSAATEVANQSTPAVSNPPIAPRLLSVSARFVVGRDPMLPPAVGFMVTGPGSGKYLIRFIGPTLSKFGLVDCLADPILKLVGTGGSEVATNDGWSNHPGDVINEIERATNMVGAFSLAMRSRDAVLLLTLSPGAYTAVLVSGAGSVGQAMFEIYQLPE